MEALPIVQELNAAMKTKWVGVANLLKKSPPKLAHTHLGNISKSVKKGLYKIEGDIVSEQEFVAFLEWVRSEVDIAIPPHIAHSCSEAFDLEDVACIGSLSVHMALVGPAHPMGRRTWSKEPCVSIANCKAAGA